jgi:quercetin dioxygenase-like cupin family protein
MARSLDLAIGGLVGAAAMATVVAVAADSPTADPLRVSPQYYAVRLDNDRVRVLEWRLKPGLKEAMHSHPEGFVFALADATLRSTLADGTSTTHDYVSGEVTWRNAVTHAIENVGGTEAHVLAVELKGCSR